MKRFTAIMSVLAMAVALTVAGCAGNKPKEPEEPRAAIAGELKGAPDWVIKGCAAYWGEKEEKRICGVGSVGGTRNISLARSGAIARARTEIARTLQVKIKSMLKDYSATTTGGEDYGAAAADEQHIEEVSKQITDMTLSGTEMVDSWMSDMGTLFVLVTLDLEGFKSAVDQMENLTEEIRQAVIERADNAFVELEEEIEKERGQ